MSGAALLRLLGGGASVGDVRSIVAELLRNPAARARAGGLGLLRVNSDSREDFDERLQTVGTMIQTLFTDFDAPTGLSSNRGRRRVVLHDGINPRWFAVAVEQARPSWHAHVDSDLRLSEGLAEVLDAFAALLSVRVTMRVVEAVCEGEEG